jgi:hypothetical protein
VFLRSLGVKWCKLAYLSEISRSEAGSGLSMPTPACGESFSAIWKREPVAGSHFFVPRETLRLFLDHSPHRGDDVFPLTSSFRLSLRSDTGPTKE